MSDDLEQIGQAHNRFLTSLVTGQPQPDPATSELSQDGPVDFDGGARETAPAPTDPVRDHDELIAALARRGY
jgi:hypothetical protein